MLNLISISLFVMIGHVLSEPVIYSFQHKTVLNGSFQMCLRWEVLEKELAFELELQVLNGRTYEYVMVGWVPNDVVKGADACLWRKSDGIMTDVSIDADGTIVRDNQQDCKFLGARQMPDGRVLLRWRRAKDTCDDTGDIQLKRESTGLLFVVGTSTRANVLSDLAHRSIEHTRLIADYDFPPALPQEHQTIALHNRNVSVPSKRTTYWCSLNRLPPLKDKHHIIRTEPYIQPGHEHLVHHMEVYLCSKPSGRHSLTPYNGECLNGKMPAQLTSCKHVIGAWAMGAKAFEYPSQAGLAIGGEDYYPYAVLEVHYNNVRQQAGMVDSSGMRFYYTPKLRQHDAGILETGLMYSDVMVVPPRQSLFPLTGYCVPECSDMGWDSRGVSVFASQLHAHGTGRRLRTSIIRDKLLVGYVNYDDHFSHTYQEIRPLNPHIRLYPGDVLATTCDDDSSERANVTLGGYGIEDEMCVNYMHYYPKQQLEVCKSAINNRSMNAFLNEHAPIPGRVRQSLATRMRRVQWNSQTVEQLTELYSKQALNVQCLGHSGKPLSGTWSSVRMPIADSWLPHAPRDCPIPI